MTLEEENEYLKRRVEELEATVNVLREHLSYVSNGGSSVDAMMQLTERIKYLEECIMKMGQQR